MKLTVLVENTTLIDKYLLGEPGLSFLLEAGGKKILFDTGYSDVFIKNAKLLGIPLEDLDYIVISHGHNDHVGGLKPLLNLSFKKSVKLIAHSAAFEPKLYGKDEKIGLDIPLEVLAEKFELSEMQILELDGVKFITSDETLFSDGSGGQSFFCDEFAEGY